MTLGLGDLAFVGSLTGGAAYDADAQDFINRVIAADVAAGNTSGLEVGVQDAYNAFVVGCKADGIWSAIKASCILAGARTLNGCLVPLVGTAPTNNNFVSGDYNRKTGLVGNGSTKYLDSNRNNNADPQNNNHNCLYISSANNVTQVLMGTTGGVFTGANSILNSGGNIFTRNRTSSARVLGTATPLGLLGTSRSSSSEYVSRYNKLNTTTGSSSQIPQNFNVCVFAGFGPDSPSNSRISFYSIGESLDLALLDARVTTLINAIAAAIP